MNKRIQDLALQASEHYDYHPEFAKKFAQLLIQEVIQVVNVNGSNLESEIASDIKQHFGVKE